MNYYDAKLNYLLMFKQLKDIDERLIATDSYSSYSYATNILKGRFILGETEIARNYLLTEYYNDFLKDKGIKFQLLHDTINYII